MSNAKYIENLEYFHIHSFLSIFYETQIIMLPLKVL